MGGALSVNRAQLSRPVGIATAFLALLGLVWGWAAWRHGAYFGADGGPAGLGGFYPVAIVVLLATVPLNLFQLWRGRLRGPGAIALFALLGLAAWTLVSMAWTPAEEAAVDDAERYLFYGFAFGLGILLCNMLGRRMEASLLPVVLAGALVAVATALTVGIGEDAGDYFHTDGSLRFPFGYHSANAAFFLVAFFGVATAAANRRLDWWMRGALIGIGALLLDLAVLCQSRGSVAAFAVGLVVLIALHPDRVRAAAAMLLAGAAAAGAMPWLLDVYTTETVAGSDLLPELHRAAVASGISAVAAALAGSLIARADDHYFPPVPIRFSSGRSAALGAALTVAALAAAFVAAVGDPVEWTSDRIDEFEAGGGATASGSKFTGGLGSNRDDLWRVAIDRLEDDPLQGDGAGGFRYAYLVERDSDETPDDPHGIGFTLASELGVPGVLLMAVFLVTGAAGALRSWRLGPSAQLLTAGALAAAAVWLVSSSYDWNWTFPALTAPVVALLGAACAPALLDTDARRPPGRIGVAIAAVALAATMVPLYLSERYSDQAYETWRDDLSRAYEDLERAADLNPFSDRPLLGKALIAREASDPAVALDSLERAIDRKPNEWSAHYYLGTMVLQDDPARAATELETAARLNPRNEDIAAALSALGPATR